MDDQFMVAAYLSTDESLADLRCGVLDTGCNNTCYTGSGLRGLFNRSMGAPIQGASGISKPGTKGDSYVYFCSADPNQQGTVHLVKGQSVESFPRDLISTDQFTQTRATVNRQYSASAMIQLDRRECTASSNSQSRIHFRSTVM